MAARKVKPVDISFWLCAALTLVVANTCVQIEYHNWRAGNYMQAKRVQEPDSKWRWAPTHDSFRARYIESMRLRRDATEDELKAPPSAEELDAFEAWRQVGLRVNRLHWWVCTFGVHQYLLAPACLTWAGFLVVRSRKYRIPSIAFAAVSVVCIFMMCYRQYFQSLGW